MLMKYIMQIIVSVYFFPMCMNQVYAYQKLPIIRNLSSRIYFKDGVCF